jgi:hypothetical protein
MPGPDKVTGPSVPFRVWPIRIRVADLSGYSPLPWLKLCKASHVVRDLRNQGERLASTGSAYDRRAGMKPDEGLRRFRPCQLDIEPDRRVVVEQRERHGRGEPV